MELNLSLRLALYEIQLDRIPASTMSVINQVHLISLEPLSEDFGSLRVNL